MRDRGRGRLRRERTTDYDDYEPNGHMHYSSSQYNIPRSQTTSQPHEQIYFPYSEGSDPENFQLSPPEEVDSQYLDNEYHLPFPNLYVSSRPSARH